MTQLEEVIQQHNIDAIQSTLITYITSDPLDKNGEVARALREIDSSQIPVWDKHNGRELIQEQSQWTKEYFAKLQSHLITNFSKERFETICKVGKEAYKDELLRKTESAPTSHSVEGEPKYKQKPSVRYTFGRNRDASEEREKGFSNALKGFFNIKNSDDEVNALHAENTQLVNENSSLKRQLKRQEYKIYELQETNASLTKKIKIIEEQLEQMERQAKL